MVESKPPASIFEPKSQRAIAFSVPQGDNNLKQDSQGNLVKDTNEPESAQLYSKDQILESIQGIQQR